MDTDKFMLFALWLIMVGVFLYVIGVGRQVNAIHKIVTAGQVVEQAE